MRTPLIPHASTPNGGRAARPVHESPTLAAAAESAVPAYELKFLVTEAEAGEVEARLRGHLVLDPHADPTLGNAYRVTSVYYDTPGFDVYRKADDHAVQKFRVRRYGADPSVFLERKAKQAGRVWKTRTAVPLGELDGLTDGRAGWPGGWFARELTGRGLRPVCRVSYERTAFVGAGPDGSIRLTLDRSARGLPVSGHRVEPVVGGHPLLNGDVILELKFCRTMPPLFKELIEALRLSRRGASKYRRCAEAAGLVAADAA